MKKHLTPGRYPVPKFGQTKETCDKNYFMYDMELKKFLGRNFR